VIFSGLLKACGSAPMCSSSFYYLQPYQCAMCSCHYFQVIVNLHLMRWYLTSLAYLDYDDILTSSRFSVGPSATAPILSDEGLILNGCGTETGCSIPLLHLSSAVSSSFFRMILSMLILLLLMTLMLLFFSHAFILTSSMTMQMIMILFLMILFCQ